MNRRSSRTTVLLDRDGVILRNRADYVKSWAEAEFLPGALNALVRMTTAGFRLVVVSNQSAIGRGILSRERVDEIHTRLRQEVINAGGEIDLFLTCPHMPAAGCECRKPQPGLLLEAQRRLGFNLATAYMVGDQKADLLAAQAAGCQPILVLSGVAPEPWVGPAPCPAVRDLSAAAEIIVGLPQKADITVVGRPEWSMS